MREKNTLTSKTTSGLIWMFSGAATQSLMQFLVLIILARLLSPNDFGVANSALVIIAFLVVFSSLGFGPALVQRTNLEKKHINTAISSAIMLGFFFSLIVYFSSSYLATFFQAPELKNILKFMSLILVMQSVSMVAEALIERELKFNLFFRVQVISYFFYGIVGVVLAFLDFGVWALAIAHTVQVMSKTLIALKLQPYKMKLKFSFKAFKELLSFSLGFSLAKISEELSIQGDNLIVGRYLGPEYLGLYGRAYQLLMVPTKLIGSVLEKVLFPSFSKIKNNKSKLTSYYLEGNRLIATITIPISLFLIYQAESIIYVLFGSKWLSVEPVFQILAISLVFRTSYKISDALSNAVGAVYRRAWRKWVYAFSVVIGAFIGQFYSLEGVAWGVLISIVINYLLMLQLSNQILNLKFFHIMKIYIPAFIISLILYIILRGSDYVYDEENLRAVYGLIINGMTVVVVTSFFVLKYPSFFIGPNMFRIIAPMLNKIKGEKS